MSEQIRSETGGVEVFMETSQALGYLVLSFSHLLFTIEMATIDFMAPRSLEERNMFAAALGERTAKPIISSFCTVFATRFGSQMQAADKNLLKKLSGELEALASKRNRLMHDAWFTTIDSTSGKAADMTLHRVAGRISGAEVASRKVDAREISELARDCVRLNGCVARIGWIAVDNPEAALISLRIEVVDGKLACKLV